MSVNLSKKEVVSLEKISGGGLKKVFMGLGWDQVSKKSGFLGKMFGGGGGDEIDLDASCILMGNKNVVDTVWFRQLSGGKGSVKHMGDNLTGEGDGDDEVIKIDLTKLPPEVDNVVFVVSSFRGQTFEQIESCFCRLVNEENGKELVKYNLSGKNNSTGQVMARLFKENGSWSMQAIGEAVNGQVVNDFIADVRKYI
jgi:tellurium resistance protein TerZ